MGSVWVILDHFGVGGRGLVFVVGGLGDEVGHYREMEVLWSI